MFYFSEKYVNPFTDFGFKKIFGEEPNKDLLIDFLNELLKEEQGHIKDLTYLKTEQLGTSADERKAIFDLYCENEKGEKFIVELQKAKQNFFKDRMVYYSTFPIISQGIKTDWNYELKAVYTIAILDFIFDEDKDEPNKYRYDIKLSHIDTNKVFYDKLTYIYLEMPKFNKTIDDLETRFEKWLYVIKNLSRFDNLPSKLQERIFEKLFKVAEIAKFTHEQYLIYEDSLKTYRDMKNSFDTARDEGMKLGFDDGFEEGKEKGLQEGIEKGLQEGIEKGFEEGKEKGLQEGKLEVAKNLLKNNVPIEIIIKSTGLSETEINIINIE